MEEKLQTVLKEYIRDVEEVCNILVKSINTSENLNLKNKYDFFVYRSNCKKMEFEAGGISYRLHGKGCVAFNAEKFIDWDFGYRSRWCGINPWRVSTTLKKNNSLHVEYYDGVLLQASCEQLVKKGIMFKQNDQYYFKMIENESYKPEFPTEFDILVIEYFNSSWSIPRNKVIDRFIRKSTRVHNHINKDEDKYMLRFLLKGKEIYSIPYNDISYPENAVKIMSDEIIKNLLKAQ
ncbi:hypothetical protein AALA79_20545 [Lachnospiraceae bacterium 64-25]